MEEGEEVREEGRNEASNVVGSGENKKERNEKKEVLKLMTCGSDFSPDTTSQWGETFLWEQELLKERRRRRFKDFPIFIPFVSNQR